MVRHLRTIQAIPVRVGTGIWLKHTGAPIEVEIPRCSYVRRPEKEQYRLLTDRFPWLKNQASDIAADVEESDKSFFHSRFMSLTTAQPSREIRKD